MAMILRMILNTREISNINKNLMQFSLERYMKVKVEPNRIIIYLHAY
jgi:hypothetical protein